ncbi:cleavage and polyadenylation specificity factor subunit [Fomitopsis serialis]|uniref:cleavage and polyadenylation specificity factor subunit n=1 Tax=Fomitopsis serialis TaxID=139415 RepID=UPI00200820AD|nr:cleavage and polyadenylation specificity factor subunit [Neoantrodia serialis]KAH9938343.1 cleavage and polyadenylation specificity factor subunit [Neoantrodia serialis]
MITFTPLSGAARSARTIPLAYLLQVDDVRILLDCGSPDWCPEGEPGEQGRHWDKYCDTLKEYAPSVDLVLLSHGDLQHSGLYPYAFAQWGLTAPAYTTLPVQAMARIAATEDVEGIRDEQQIGDSDERQKSSSPEAGGSAHPEDNAEKSTTPPPKAPKGRYIATLHEVHEAFDSVNVLRYSQPCHLQGKCQGLTIIPFNAGHTLGGTIWKIRSPTAGTILYAVDMNHMRERHLDGTVLVRQASAGGGVFESLARPDLLITDAERAVVTTARRKDRDAALLDCIDSTLTSRNSVLMPCDSSTRVLELLVLLDQHWNYSRLKFPICLLSRTGREMLTFVRSMMEWLGGTISKEDVGETGTGGNKNKRRRDDDDNDDALGAFALRFPHLEFFPTPQSLMQTYSSKDPKLILAVPASLSHGPSRAVFSEFAETPDNVVLLTGRSEEGTLGRVLFDKWDDSQRDDAKWDRGKIGNNVMMDGVLHLEMHAKVPLQGAELEEYLAKERAVQEKEAAQKAAQARAQRILEADEGEDDTDEDSEAESDDEENEVEEALDDELMDTDDGAPPQAPPNGRMKRKSQKGGTGEGKDWIDDVGDELAQKLSFDIYLKGNVSKATSFFKSEGQTQRFRMFPYVEKKRRVDEYGETVDVGMWLRKGKVLEEDAESEEVKEMRRRAEEEAKKAPTEPPSKFVRTEVDVQLACRLFFVDMEGLNDGRAVKTIVPQVNPRKMIIVHAPAQATDALIESCSNIRAMTRDIYAPTQGENVQIGQHTNSFSISLSDELLASLKISQFEDNEIGYVAGRISSLAGSTIPVLEPMASRLPEKVIRKVQRPRTLGSRPTRTLPQSTMIGELKLTALKARLAKVGVHSELIGEGVLICGPGKKGASAESIEHTVAVKKTTRGRVEVEGTVSDVYYVVRREIYNLHALVAA